MVTSELLKRSPVEPALSRQRKWGWAQCLAVVAIPILVWEVWTVVAWLADGPHQITEFRESGTRDWYAARVFEGLAIVMAIAVAIPVVRGCMRSRKILTFDVMFCICGATIFWADLGLNFLQPVVVFSSNFVNLNNTCGHMPFVVNPDCGRAPDPILFMWLLETFGALGVAMLCGWVVRRARNRWPGITKAKTIGLVMVVGMVLAGFEVVGPALHVWTYPGAPLAIPVGKGYAYPLLPELFAFGIWFGILASVRIFKDDRGQTIVERGLDRYGPKTRKTISLLALYAIFQLAVWVQATPPDWPLGIYAQRWPELPAHLINGVCDAPGTTGTRYGPCPGSPGYRMPARHSLPGSSP